ncbi:MAG: hypothetical protein WC488_01505 [Candidatus Micrarchaeia archaeon]
MASQSGDGRDVEGRSILDTIKEDRYVLIMAVAVLIFIASSSLALMNSSSGQGINPTPFVSAQVEGGTVKLTWGASDTPGVSGYNIYRSASSGVLGAKVNQDLVSGLSYEDSAGPGIYHYTVRASTGPSEDKSLNQLIVVVSDQVPTRLSIAINGGGQYATSESVTLSLSAQDAVSCRYKNDEDLAWSPWEKYASGKAWALSAGADGERLVAYQCKGTGESDIAVAKTILDRTPPSVVYVLSTTAGEVTLSVFVKDLLSESVDCAVSIDGAEEAFSVALGAGKEGAYVYKKNLAKGEPSIALGCSDNAGNRKDVPAQEVSVQ